MSTTTFEDGPSATVTTDQTTLGEKPEEYTNRRTGDSCENCGRAIRESQTAVPEHRERVKPQLSELNGRQRERLKAEGIQITEYVREYRAESEHFCPVHGLHVETR